MFAVLYPNLVYLRYKSSRCLSIIQVESGGKVIVWEVTLSVIVRQKTRTALPVPVKVTN